MKILVLNCGSSSLKFQLIETTPERIAANQDIVLARGSVEKIGSPDALFSYRRQGGGVLHEWEPIPDYKQAIQAAFDAMTREGGVLAQHSEIEAVGHRVVHGGEDFQQSVLVDGEVLKKIEAASELAPLHNPHNLKGYFASRELLPHARHVAVFDTSFHQTMPLRAFLYGIPYIYYTRDKLRRYGFHGTSHRYVSGRFAQIHNRAPADCTLITCHLGNGCSVCAIDHGKSVDTSMGFTPLEGLLMGTRPGDLDAGAVTYLGGRPGMGLPEVNELLNKESGLYGISGVSNDMRDLLQERKRGNERASIAIEVFCYRIRKYIGAYLAALGGPGAVVFTGGIGENAATIRAEACAGLEPFGIAINQAKNQAALGREAEIGESASKVAVWVIPTNEELLIARDTLRVISGLPPL